MYNFQFSKVNTRQIKKPITRDPKRVILKSYTEPIIKDMAVLLVYFNPCKYNRLIQNILTVKHLLDEGKIPYFISEIQFNDDPFLFASSDTIFQYRSNSYMFYKENLIATMERQIAAVFTKICMIDSDIFFDNPDWYSVISDKLNSVQVTQPFTRAYMLNIDYSIQDVKTNCIDKTTTNPVDYNIEHTGYLWAFDRKWFQNYHFNDKFLACFGDTILANNITKRVDNGLATKIYYFNSLEKPYLEKVIYDSCDLNIYHLNHGRIINRQYTSFLQILDNLLTQLNHPNIDTIYTRRDDNILEWSPKYITRFNTIMLKYFNKRYDDSI